MKELERLSEEERRALRGSKFAPLPSSSYAPPRSNPRLAHPGGPLTTNKAAALAKFLERKLQEPNGIDSLNPDLLELAVKNAKESVTASRTSGSGRTIRHIDSYEDSDVACEDLGISEVKKDNKKKKNKKKRKKKQEQQLQKANKDKKKKKMMDDTGCVIGKKSKKMKL